MSGNKEKTEEEDAFVYCEIKIKAYCDCPPSLVWGGDFSDLFQLFEHGYLYIDDFEIVEMTARNVDELPNGTEEFFGYVFDEDEEREDG